MIRYLVLSSLILFITQTSSFSQETPCVDGRAGIYPCSNVSLLSRLSPSDLLAEFDLNWNNDLWGWTDPSTKIEYVIIGAPNGTTFVEILNPEAPRVIGFLPSHNNVSSRWRDMKVYSNYAFIVSEAPGHGMQIFDLTKLRDVTAIPMRFSEDAHYGEISNSHNIAIDTVSGFAYAVAATNSNICSNGGLHIIDIRDPLNPTYAGCYDNVGVIHDTQCVVYQGEDERYQGKQICFNSSETSVTIVDVTDKESTKLLSSIRYDNVTYTHQGWLTEDHKYFLCNDELDELAWGNQTRTLIFDVSDLENPDLVGESFTEGHAIDHNLYIHNGLVFSSNYTTGLRIFETSEIAEGRLNEIAYFDSYPSNDNTELAGNWSNYPFFESGVIAISDMASGLFLLQPNLVTSSRLNWDELNIYPIPAKNTITLNNTNQLGQIIKLEIFDYSGKMMQFQDYIIHENSIKLSTKSLNNGTYFLSIYTDKGAVNKKVIVSK